MNSKYSKNRILNFVAEQLGCSKDEVELNTDLVKDLGCYGDDLDEFIRAYSKEFQVDVSGYLWYFHAKEEGNSFGGAFFRPPNERVNRVVITPALLFTGANRGTWPITYPEHTLPKRRYDILINQLLAILFIVFLVYRCTR